MSKIELEYGCRNTAFHTEACCSTCWIKHPDFVSIYNEKHGMFLNTPAQRHVEREMWIDEAMKLFANNFGVSRELIEFMYDNFQQR